MPGRQTRWYWCVLVLFLLLLGLLFLAGSRPPGARAAPGAEAAAGIRGMAYGPFREGQSPEWGIYPSLEEVREDIPLLEVVSNGVRIYGCQHSEPVITATREISLPLTLGAWLSGNPTDDAAEIACAVGQAQANPHVASVVVGNETILFGHLTVTDVCSHTQQVRGATGLPVTTAEPWHVWTANPALAACVDYLLVHIHPYWECQPIGNAVAFVQEKYALVSAQYFTRTVVIGETGWPSAGTGREGHCGPMPTPSIKQQSLFAGGFLDWSRAEGVGYYYFEAFDEPWKCTGGRAEVECHWGIYTTEREPKPAQPLFLSHRLWLPFVLRGH